MQKYKLFDISLSLNEKTIVYPGNPLFRTEIVKGLTSAVSTITLGSHAGTHVDAPKHVFKGGKGVDTIDLQKLTGKCRVVDFTAVEEAITPKDIEHADIKEGERILAKTKNSVRGFNTFYKDYVCLSGDAAEVLAQKNIVLFGIDYLAVKKFGSSDNRPHTELLRNDIVIFEGLDLSQIEPGEYFFIGLPLKLTNLDGAPARAILLQNF